VSVVLVVRYLATAAGSPRRTLGGGEDVALYAIMVTGALWERAVFGKYLFARAFFWEDVVSMA
jgi:3-vinyl bacteriochlorophyllide hydratase